MTDFELDGETYRIGKLTPMIQFHVTRRVAPIMAEVGVGLKSLSTGGDLQNDDVLLKIMSTAWTVMAKMEDADAEYVIHSCLAVVQKQDSGKWQRVMNGKQFQYGDMDMKTMLRLTVEVLKENLSGFFTQQPDEAPTSGA